jgi:hypothetical protein
VIVILNDKFLEIWEYPELKNATEELRGCVTSDLETQKRLEMFNEFLVQYNYMFLTSILEINKKIVILEIE